MVKLWQRLTLQSIRILLDIHFLNNSKTTGSHWKPGNVSRAVLLFWFLSQIISKGVKYGDFIGTFSINLLSTSKKSHLMLTTFLWGKKNLEEKLLIPSLVHLLPCNSRIAADIYWAFTAQALGLTLCKQDIYAHNTSRRCGATDTSEGGITDGDSEPCWVRSHIQDHIAMRQWVQFKVNPV